MKVNLEIISRTGRSYRTAPINLISVNDELNDDQLLAGFWEQFEKALETGAMLQIGPGQNFKGQLGILGSQIESIRIEVIRNSNEDDTVLSLVKDDE